MKFYIASRVKNKKMVERIHQELLNKKHSFTSDWIEEDNIIPYEKHLNEANLRAKKCIESINNCDVFVLISDEAGAGMYTELGVALQLVKNKKKPKIYIIGDYNNRNVFFFHNLVKRKRNLKEIFTDLEDM